MCDAPFLKHRKQALKGAPKPRRAKSDQGRLGILVFNRRNQAIVAVEVKRAFVFSNIKGDLDKLKSLLLRHGHVKGSTFKAGYSVSIRELSEAQATPTRDMERAVARRLRPQPACFPSLTRVTERGRRARLLRSATSSGSSRAEG